MARINQSRFFILTSFKGLIDFIFAIVLSVIYKNESFVMQFKEDKSDHQAVEKTLNSYNSETDLYKMILNFDYTSQVYVRAYMIQYILTSMLACTIACQCGNLQVNYKCNFLQSAVFLFIYCIIIILHVGLLDDLEEQSKKSPEYFSRLDLDNYYSYHFTAITF